MRLIYLSLIAIAGMVGAGCASTAPALADGVAADVTTPPAADGIAQWERRAYTAAQLGTAVYLMSRDNLDAQQREAVRQTWLAFDAVIVGLRAEGAESVDVPSALAEAVARHVTDDRLRPLALVFIQQVIDGIKARVPVDRLTGSDTWRIALAVHSGIANTLIANGIDPTRPVRGSAARDRA